MVALQYNMNTGGINDNTPRRQCPCFVNKHLITAINMNNLSEVDQILRISPKSVEGCNCKTVKVGSTKPLHLAASLGHIEICKRFLKHAKTLKDVQVYNMKDDEGKTPIFCSSSSEIVELFLEAGLENLETTLAGGYTLLHHCVEKVQVSQKLAQMLQDQWLKKDHGDSPLNNALEYSATGAAKLRLQERSSEQPLLKRLKADNEEVGTSKPLRPIEMSGAFAQLETQDTFMQRDVKEEIIELLLTSPDMTPLEAHHLYVACLRHKLYSPKLAGSLCPVLCGQNYGKEIIVINYFSFQNTLLT